LVGEEVERRKRRVDFENLEGENDHLNFFDPWKGEGRARDKKKKG